VYRARLASNLALIFLRSSLERMLRLLLIALRPVHRPKTAPAAEPGQSRLKWRAREMDQSAPLGSLSSKMFMALLWFTLALILTSRWRAPH
jgi:hypothetical protein